MTYWYEPTATPMSRLEGHSPETRYRLHSFFTRARMLCSTVAGAEVIGEDRTTMVSLAKSQPETANDYEMTIDFISSQRLTGNGYECRNGCGPVGRGRNCPTCGVRAWRENPPPLCPGSPAAAMVPTGSDGAFQGDPHE